MAYTCVKYLVIQTIITSTGIVVSEESCKGCFLGNGWASSPCSDCCCSRDVPKHENCCYKLSDKNTELNQEGPISGTYIYFMAILFTLIFMIFALLCCFRIADINCMRLLGFKNDGRNRSSTSDRATHCDIDNNNISPPPPYFEENIEMQELQIVVPKSPPYIKDPPPYTEAWSNPADISHCTNSDDG